jgi:hypothetical protein
MHDLNLELGKDSHQFVLNYAIEGAISAGEQTIGETTERALAAEGTKYTK